MYYARQEGYKSLGLQPLPTLQISEYNSKLAIKMMILLQSLANSKYGAESWSLPETSAEIVLTPPKNTFKKDGFQVEVYYDNDRENSMLYTQWNSIYYQDEKEQWHKAVGEVDHNGLSFTDNTNEKRYFLLFHEDASKYGKTGLWTVKYKTTTISSVVTSSTKRPSVYSEESHHTNRNSRESSPEEGTSRGRLQGDSEEVPTTTTTSPTTRGERRRRRGDQRERESTTRESPRAKRRRGPSYPTPSEVGSRHQSVPQHNLTRLGRLEAEARDPLLICLKGSANNLKCWRYRCNLKCGHLFSQISSIFKWIGGEDDVKFSSRMLISFDTNAQRERFLHTVSFPRGTRYSFGSLDSL